MGSVLLELFQTDPRDAVVDELPPALRELLGLLEQIGIAEHGHGERDVTGEGIGLVGEQIARTRVAIHHGVNAKIRLGEGLVELLEELGLALQEFVLFWGLITS